MVETRTHTFRVSYADKVYREFEIPSSKRLYDLARAIIDAFDFDFDHAFGFYSKLQGHVLDSPTQYDLFVDMDEESAAGSVKRTRISEAFPSIGAKMTFLYDYGDEWLFRVEVIGQGEKQKGVKYPRLLKSVGKAPEQYPDPDDDDE